LAIVTPAAGLSPGTYTATVTVSAGNSTSPVYFPITLVVEDDDYWGSTTYTTRTLTHSATGVRVYGRMVGSASLSVVENSLHAQGTCTACDTIREWMAAGNVIKTYNINISNGYTGDMLVSIPVGSAYNGQQLTMVHDNGGYLERSTVTVNNGYAASTYASLSPFAVLNGVYSNLPGDNTVVDPPKTGGEPVYFSWGALAVTLSLLLACVCAIGILYKKRKGQN
jgi:hypothetical protein